MDYDISPLSIDEYSNLKSPENLTNIVFLVFFASFIFYYIPSKHEYKTSFGEI